MRLAHTVRHLKPVQIYARALNKLSRVRPDPAPAPPLRQPSSPWAAPVARTSSLAEGWRVRFLNAEGEIARPEQWNDPTQPKLWLYNLHYFDDLGAADGARRRDLQRALVARWIAENPPPAGNGWEAYPISLRIVNWIKWHLAGEALDAGMRDSLAMQARWLMGHVEWHLLGNHILANAKGLVFAGLFFSGPDADRWLAQGLAIYDRELPEQILADGAHFELSPMYHAIILEDVLDLLNIARAYGCEARAPLAGLAEIAQSMRQWLAAMTHPDGGPAFFNDAAFGIAASRAELEAYAERLGLAAIAEPGEGVHHLAASGYVRVNRGPMAAILDVAAIGPDYLPGHAHADTLSFELSLGGERVIVNGGTSTYDSGPQREKERSTAAHSTVEIDHENSSEVWASFRVARRARITELAIEERGHQVSVLATHDGYRRLAGRPLHRRAWRFDVGSVTIRDTVEGAPGLPALARYHLGDGVAAVGGRHGRFITAAGHRLAWSASSAAQILPALWSREFGRRVPTSTLVAPLHAGALALTLEWH